ncbi:MAG: hypothetical protein ACW98Y_15240 [Candidatus Thorarchaeota archaeon]|jgi:hypothetical protein
MKKYLALSIILVLTIGFGLTTLPTSKSTTAEVSTDCLYRPAAVVWEDNFDDGNMDDWYVYMWPDVPPEYTITDGIVYTDSEDDLFIAVHNSSVAYGTWSFDVYASQGIGVEFLSLLTLENGSRGDYPPITTVGASYAYELLFAPDGRAGVDSASIILAELYITSIGHFDYRVLDYYLMNPAGWYHVDITRDNTGYFCVYLNGEPLLEAIDNTVTTSSGFSMAIRPGCAFDNVSVSDSVGIDWVAPYILQQPTDQVIAYGEDFRYKLNATDYSGTVTWSINDTAQFAISNEGLITNNTDLEPGVYGLNVSVVDDDSYERSVSFSVIVEESIVPPLDPTPIIVAGGGLAVVVIVVLVIYLKKRT